jgi:translation initiation factor IF-3
MILNRLADELEDLAVIEQRPQQDGRNMTMMLAPGRTVGADDDSPAAKPERAGQKPRSAPQSRAPGSAQPAETPPDVI